MKPRIHHRHGRPAETMYLLGDALDGLVDVGGAAYTLVTPIAGWFGRIPRCPETPRDIRPETAGHALVLTCGRTNRLFCEVCGISLSPKLVLGHDRWSRFSRFVDLLPVPV